MHDKMCCIFLSVQCYIATKNINKCITYDELQDKSQVYMVVARFVFPRPELVGIKRLNSSEDAWL